MTEYQDYKYVIQDTSKLYIGAKFSLEELSKHEQLSFKFRSIVMRHVMPNISAETTLEYLFYYMKPEGYLYEMFLQLKTRVKVTRLTEKKNLFGKVSYIHKEMLYKLSDFVQIFTEEKEAEGILIQEIQFANLAIMTFSL